MGYRRLGRTGWLTGGYRKDRALDHLKSKLGATDVMLSVDILDRVDEIVPPGSTVSGADQGYLPPSLADPFVRRRRTE